MASVAAPWSLAYYPSPPPLCVDSSVKVILYFSMGSGAPTPKSTFQEGGKRREEKGWLLPFKVTSWKYQTLPLTYHWLDLVTWPQVATRESLKCPLAGILLSQINLGFVTEKRVKGCCDEQPAVSVTVTF